MTDKDPEEMSNQELVESIAALDHETYPIAEICQNALEMDRTAP